MAGLYEEIWTGELLKKFRQEATFLKGIPDFSGRVAGNNTIHFVDIGSSPTILINNNTYPIPVAGRTDADIAIALDHLETTNTEVKDADLEGLSYDKIHSVNEDHVETLSEGGQSKAAHALAPNTNTAKTPVITTVAAKFGIADLIALKKKFDDAKWPKKGRRLTLCSRHSAELLTTSQTFEKQYNLDEKTGAVGNLYGFEIHEYVDMPVYDGGNRVAYGAVVPGTAKEASTAFVVKRMFQAQGKVTKYQNEAKKDPINRKTVIGYGVWNIALPKKQEAMGAILSQ